MRRMTRKVRHFNLEKFNENFIAAMLLLIWRFLLEVQKYIFISKYLKDKMSPEDVNKSNKKMF